MNSETQKLVYSGQQFVIKILETGQYVKCFASRSEYDARQHTTVVYLDVITTDNINEAKLFETVVEAKEWQKQLQSSYMWHNVKGLNMAYDIYLVYVEKTKEFDIPWLRTDNYTTYDFCQAILRNMLNFEEKVVVTELGLWHTSIDEN